MRTRKREARSEGATTTKIIFSTTLEPPYLIMSNEEVKYGKILGESEKIMPNRYRGVIFYCVTIQRRENDRNTGQAPLSLSTCLHWELVASWSVAVVHSP